MGLNVESLRKDFPALARQVHGHPLIYLDSAASALRAKPVVEALSQYYLQEASNVHRGAHFLSDLSTEKFEGARRAIQAFLNAKSSNEIVFTRGTTESINLVAQSYGRSFLASGDEILLTEMEHHSNIIPWQILAQERDLVLKVVPVKDDGSLNADDFRKLLSDRTKIVAMTVCSNTLGTINPVKALIADVRSASVDAKVVLDAAQSVSFMKNDVQSWDCDFLAFSGHKIFGPNGIGVLYGREELLNSMPPYQGGGSMISTVTFEKSDYLESPQRFEAGTPNVGGAIGLGEAVQFVEGLGFENIHAHEQAMLIEATSLLKSIPDLRIVGEAPKKSSLVSFNIEGIHPSDMGQLLDRYGVAVRVGHHCTQPLMRRFGITGTVRASFSIYNTLEEVRSFVKFVKKVKEFF